METLTADILGQLKAEQGKMLEQLYAFCEINSGSENLSGLHDMATQLHHSFDPIADIIESIPAQSYPSINMQGVSIDQPCGAGLLIQKRPELKRRILLSGHMDTVYSVDHPFQKLTQISDTEINGPGVSDMKGGLIVILHALTALETQNIATDLGWDVFINADEEIGSPTSSKLFPQLAPKYQAALVYEPAMTKHGTLAKNRKGSGKLTLVVKGKAAHAGRAFHEGRNAICYLSQVITEVHALNGLRDGVTINVGLVSGGEALNIVPEHAIAKLDVRITDPEDETWVIQQLNAIKTRLRQPDYTLNIHGEFSRPVKKVDDRTEKLFTKLQKISDDMGIGLDWKDSGGCCDGNNLAACGLPVLDTLGVRGGCIHSSDEFIVTDSLSERAALSALLLIDLAKGGLEEIAA